MIGFPVPDFDFDDEEPYHPIFPVRTTLHTLSEEEVKQLNEKRGLSIKSDSPLRCTSNSAVYEAVSSDGMCYAVKITEHKRRVKDEYYKRLQVQDSPYLVKTIAYFETQRKAFLQMELCPEGDIASFDFDEQYVWLLIFDIANALYQLHSENWMHLDVSPGNILNVDNEMFKLADFGTLTLIGEFEEGKEGAGPFVSPEALAHPHGPRVEAPTDIFSFGVVLLEVISKQLAPRGGCDGYAKLRKGELMLGSPGFPANCSIELRDLVNCMLSVDPDSRPTALQLVNIARTHI